MPPCGTPISTNQVRFETKEIRGRKGAFFELSHQKMYILLTFKTFPAMSSPQVRCFFPWFPILPISIFQIPAQHLLRPLTRWSFSSSSFWSGDPTPNLLRPLAWVHPTDMPVPSQLPICYFLIDPLFLCSFLSNSLHV